MNKLHTLFAAAALSISLMALPESAQTENQASFEGMVVTVEGKRLEIELTDGSRIWGTMETPVPEGAVGQKITGSYAPLGDTKRIESPVFEPIDQ